MSRFARQVIALFVVALSGLLLPVAYTAADEPNEGRAPEMSAEAPPSPEPTSEPTPEPTPSDTPDPQPSPSVTSPSASPEPSPSLTEAPEGPTEKAEVLGEESPLHLSLGAAPATIEIGQQTTAGIVLTNPNDAPAEDVDLIVTLPKELGYVSSEPVPDSVSVRAGKTTARFSGLVVPASGWLTIAIIAEGLEETESPATIDAEALWNTSQPSETATVNVVAPPSDLRMSTSGPGLLSSVGQTVVYNITLRNAGDAPLRDVSIVNLVPSEIHVTGAGLAPGIDAVQVGNSGNAEDVVWAITEMDAGEVVRVSYRGVVERPGDLEALNRTRALTGGAEAAETSERSYLTSSSGSGSDNPAFEPQTERHVVTEKVVERPLIRRRLPTEPGGVSTVAALPYTGIDPWGIAAAGLALVGLGALLVRFGSGGADRRRVLAVALLLLLIGGACISSDSGSDEGPGDTRVKGREIERNDPDADEDDNGPGSPPDGTADNNDPGDGPADDGDGDGPSGDGSADGTSDNDTPDDQSDEDPPAAAQPPGEPSEEVLVPGPPVTTFERSVRTVTLTEDELAVEAVGSIDDARTASFHWSDGGGVAAGGSASSQHEGLVRMTTSVVGAGEGMRATVTLDNVSERTKVRVIGRFDLELSGSGGGVLGTLRGGNVDVVLNPGGGSSAAFIFRLPSGDYAAQGIFQAD